MGEDFFKTTFADDLFLYIENAENFACRYTGMGEGGVNTGRNN